MIQVNSLRVLQEREIRRGSRPITVGVRLVAATNENLEAAVRADAFREDLCYRLAVGPIALLAAPSFGSSALGLHAAAVIRRSWRFQALGEYAWSGNVRELRNLAERVVGRCASAPSAPSICRRTILTGERPEGSLAITLGTRRGGADHPLGAGRRHYQC